MKNIKTILIAVLSFMLLFSVSCKNEDKTGGGSGGSVDVPTATGDPATDLTEIATYSGTVTRTVGEGPVDELFGATMEVTLIILNNQITVSAGTGTIVEKGILKSGSEYSADGERSGEFSSKEYIKFTISGDSLEILEFTIGGSNPDGNSFKATFTGTLTKYTSGS